MASSATMGAQNDWPCFNYNIAYTPNLEKFVKADKDAKIIVFRIIFFVAVIRLRWNGKTLSLNILFGSRAPKDDVVLLASTSLM